MICRLSTPLELRATPQSVPVAPIRTFFARFAGCVESEHADPSLTIRGIARHVGLSERQLQRRVLRATGLSPAAYVRTVRLRHACQQLKSGLPVGAVAHAVGFASHAYFSHCFKQEFGVSPTRYRERHRESNLERLWNNLRERTRSSQAKPLSQASEAANPNGLMKA
jgi:AraC-like DNA-binding protein